MSNKRKQLIKIILCAVLISLNVLLERLPAFKSVNSHFSLSIITLGFAAVYLGVGYTIALATFGDLLGALLFPFGAYNPLFTLTNAVMGLIIGLFLRKKASLLNISLGVLANKIVCTLLLNSMWVAIFYSGGIFAFPTVMVGRLPQAAIMTVTEIVALTVLYWEKSGVRKLLDKSIKI